MTLLEKNNKLPQKPMLVLVLWFLLIFAGAVVIALFMHQSWIKHLNLYHTILETSCIFISLSIFTSIWFTHSERREDNYILGFGFVIVAILDAFHAYYFLKLDLASAAYFDLSTRFWIAGRLTEAMVILAAVKQFKALISRYVSLAAALMIAFGISYFLVAYHVYLPILLTSEGVTPTKVFLEYVTIGLYIIGLYNLRKKLEGDGIVTYKYIFISLLMAISSELCFTIYSSVNNLVWTVGHILKIAGYFSLFRGIYISSVVYPYVELEAKNKMLKDVNNEMVEITNTMRNLLDALPIAILKLDRDCRLKYANSKFEELLQCNRKDIEKLSMLEISNMFGAEVINEKALKSALKEYEDSITIKTFTSLKGEQLKLSVKTSSIKNGTLVILSDAKKEQELENLNIQADTILNSINNGVLMINEQKKIIVFNKVFEEIYEIDRDQILGMDIDYLNDKTDFGAKELPENVLNKSMAGKVLDISITSFKGNKKEINLYVSPIKNVEGEIIGAISIGTDVTEYKKEQQRMIQQEKLALLGQLGAGIVHETRNYLTTIKGRCQLIEMITEDESIRKHSARIDDDVEEVNRLISEFLFLSKPRETELVEVSIHDVFESIKTLLDTSSLVRGVNLEVKLCEEVRYMLCDELQLKQVILNICKNGIDAMTDQANAKLIVETGFIEENNEVYINISDNGKGIAAEHLEKIGTPFFTTKEIGTGLGLSVCYKIVKDHGGRIEVQSEMGKGTSFKIILPCIADEELEGAV